MRILLADDHDLVRDTLAEFLSKEDDISVTVASDLDEAVATIEKERAFDLVLLDYSMPGMNGLYGLAKVIATGETRPVAIMSGVAKKSVAQDAIDAGAIGFLPKTMAAGSLVNAVRFMAAGETFAPIKFMTADDPTDSHPMAKGLSERELQVLEGLSRGLANKEIARELDLQEVTIKLHVKTLCRKLDVKNRTQAALMAKEAGLF